MKTMNKILFKIYGMTLYVVIPAGVGYFSQFIVPDYLFKLIVVFIGGFWIYTLNEYLENKCSNLDKENIVVQYETRKRDQIIGNIIIITLIVVGLGFVGVAYIVQIPHLLNLLWLSVKGIVLFIGGLGALIGIQLVIKKIYL